jgi:hemoglobin
MKYDTITRESIQDLVTQFYTLVRRDEILGPVFLKTIGDDWTEHLEKLVEFWSTIALGTRGFQGNVYSKHMQLMDIEPAHFQRWLGLFEKTVDRLFDEACAEQFMIMARRVAASLQLGFFGKVDVQ